MANPVLGAPGSGAISATPQTSQPSSTLYPTGTPWFTTDRGDLQIAQPGGWRSVTQQDLVVRGRVGRARQLDDFTNTATWTLANSTTGTIATTTNPDGGSPVMQITTPTGATTSVLRNLQIDGRGRYLSLRLLSDTNLSQVAVYLIVNGRTYTTRLFNDVLLAQSQLRAGVWTQVTLSMSDFTTAAGLAAMSVTSDSPASSSIKDIRQLAVDVVPNASTQTVVAFADLQIHDNPLPPGVVWSFDDARLDTYSTAFPILQAAGYTGTLYVPTSQVGGQLDANTPCASLVQLQALVAAGWQMASHTASHSSMIGMNATQLATECESSYDYLMTNGLLPYGGAHFAYPFSNNNEAVIQEVMRHYVTARTTNFKVGQTPRMPTDGRLGGVSFDTTVTSYLARAKWAMDRVVARGGQVLMITHSVGNAASATNVPTADFQTLVTYAQSLGLANYSLNDLYPA